MPDEKSVLSIVDHYIAEAVRLRGEFFHSNEKILQATRGGMNTGIRLMINMRSEIRDTQRKNRKDE